MRTFFFRPGQQLRDYYIYRRKAAVDAMGRVTNKAQPQLVEKVKGTISEASQTEKHQWNQMGHPITHRIVIRGRSQGDANDEVWTADGRVYTVQGRHDPVELGFFTSLYCLERLGVSPDPDKEEGTT